MNKCIGTKFLMSVLLIVSIILTTTVSEYSFKEWAYASEIEESEENKDTEENEQTIKILFVGNSHTYYNNLPKMVEGLAGADGINCETEAITESGYKLYEFADRNNEFGAKVYDALSSNNWDYVVLQENRKKLVEKPESAEKAVKTLYEYIKKSGAKLVMYSTHPDEVESDFQINGNTMHLTNYEIEQILTKNNFALSNQYDGLTAVSGLNFMRAGTFNPTINLYKSDNLHPSVEGSYLAACTIYATVFNKSPFGNLYLPGSDYDTEQLLKNVDSEHAITLQQIADTRININSYYTVVNKGQNSRLTAEVIFKEENHILDDYSNAVLWQSMDTNGISVNRKTGEFTALSTGRHLVMAQTDSGLMAYATIDVKQPSLSLSIKEDKILKVTKGYTTTYTPTLLPYDTTDTIKWESNEPGIVTIDETGKIVAKKVGIAKITAATDSGLKVSVYVRVKLKKPTGVSVKKLSTKAKGKKYKNIKIKWKKNSNAVNYYVFRRTSGAKSYKRIATTTTNKYIDKNKKKNKRYYYKIKAVYSNTKLNSDRSKAKSIVI